jgi:MinD superfamily P-loop ATPase
MGLIAAPEFCFITNQPTKNISNDIDRIDYSVEYFGKKIQFIFNPRHKNNSYVNNNRYILQGLILNNKIDFSKIITSMTNDFLEQLIHQATVPKTPNLRVSYIYFTLIKNLKVLQLI